MTTRVGRASERVTDERETVEAKRDAYGRFRSRVRAVSPQSVTTGGTGVTVAHASGGTSVARTIREAFAETVAPTCEERPTRDLLSAELGDEVATALTMGDVSPPLRQAILSASDQRRAELAAMDRALGLEADSLDRAEGTIERIRGWLIEKNGTPLSDCGFEELHARHDRLARFRDACEELLSDRQEHLARTTSANGRAGVRQRDLVAYLYEPFPIDHPVLVTAVRLDAIRADCQRVVRDHLVRRV